MTGSLQVVKTATRGGPGWVDRPSLVRRLAEVTDRRLTILVADAGYGKTSLLTSWAGRVPHCRYALSRKDAVLATFVHNLSEQLLTPVPGLDQPIDDIAAALLGPLSRQSDDLVLILDDLHELPADGDAARLVEAICRYAPASLHVVLSSRHQPPFSVERQRGRGELLELDGLALAFTAAETHALLSTALGEPAADDLADRLQAVTGGWPAATVLAARWLADRSAETRADEIDRLGHPGGPLFGYVSDEVFRGQPDDVAEFVRRLAPLRKVTADLCSSVGLVLGGDHLDRLARAGALLWRQDDGTFAVSPLARDAVRATAPLPAEEWSILHQQAAAWYLRNDDTKEALRCVRALGDQAMTASFICENASRLLHGGAATVILEAFGQLPPWARTADTARVEGQARFCLGDWSGALRCFYRGIDIAGAVEPRFGWRLAALYHFLGEPNRALAICEQVTAVGTAGPASADEALVLAWTAYSHWVRNEHPASRDIAARALRVAQASGNPGALADSYSVMGLLNGIDTDAHHEAAIEAAALSNNAMHMIFAHTNYARTLITRGDIRPGLAQLDVAVSSAERSRDRNMVLFTHCHRGTAKLALGRLDEAAADFQAARAGYQRGGPGASARPLVGLGEVYREHGDLALAAAAYQEAADIAAESGDQELHGVALTGLAQVRLADDPEAAASLAEQAVAASEGSVRVRAQIVAGWVALSRGDRRRLSEAVAAASAGVGIGADRGGLARLLELRAAALADQPAEQLRLLHQAADIWAATGQLIGAARVGVAVARLTEAPAPVLEAATAALRQYGVHPAAEAAAGLLRFVPIPAPNSLEVRTLGGFGLLRDGQLVGAEEWRSKKARDLFKLLVARRGRPTPRESLMDILWPDDDPTRCANRLSVALSTIRTVLDPDRRYPPDHFVGTDKYAIELRNLAVDVEVFLAIAAKAQTEYERRSADAPRALALAEATYSGDFLEEDPYQDWAVPLREEAKARYLELVRLLAGLAENAGEYDRAARYRLRALERDTFDEEAHLGLIGALVAAGRHGEAKRRYEIYRGQMAEIGIEPAPFPRRNTLRIAAVRS
ncbi:BTAD domain-containing putative transcriptional regulator [Fodinicola acaciae]|uniref:BTAD domain-containing putative transcriptional regulator n=1 Tax=Fodinicola acaciae TaxID=2681555 RepID=UPI0013D70EB6|nr:BTAD domain-containing putative transcriptional regulator [Fodinicola acaciae]